MSELNPIGRPTELTEELTLKIRQGVLDDKTYIEIQQELEISPNTWDTWVYKDYNGFRNNLTNWKKERMVKKAERVIDKSMDSDAEKIALDAAQFTLETLGKLDYSKRQEVTGANGSKLTIEISKEVADKHELTQGTENHSS
jgi:hypothetical protein